MSSSMMLGPPRDDAERERFAGLVRDTFMTTAERSRKYLDLCGRENVRLARRGEDVLGGLVLLPKGQYFGGRRIAMTGVAAVATVPEHRAEGVATELMRAALREMRAAGVPISALYPATLALYRRVGYECAGLEAEVKIPLQGIDLRDRALDVREATPADEPVIRSVYEAWARGTPGNLSRTDFHWERVRTTRDGEAQGYVFAGRDGIEGYIYLRSEDAGGWRLRVSDLAYATPGAARRILTFLADHRTVRRDVAFRSSPTEALLMHLGEFRGELTRCQPWMLRIVDVPAALRARGYGPGLRAELQFRVHDDLLGENDGAWVLRVENGEGVVERGGRAELEVGIRGLAALYTGYLGPGQIAAAGWLRGPESALAAAQAVFAGPTPWMRDAF